MEILYECPLNTLLILGRITDTVVELSWTAESVKQEEASGISLYMVMTREVPTCIGLKWIRGSNNYKTEP